MVPVAPFDVKSTSASDSRIIGEVQGLERAWVSAPAEIVPAVRQIAEALAGDLEYRVADRGLDRGGAVVAHADQPMPGREEANTDLGRVLVDARQRERVEIVLDDAPVRDRARLVHGVVVEPGDLAFDLLLHRKRVDQAKAGVVRDVDALQPGLAFAADR